jgi:hypothetical protein
MVKKHKIEAWKTLEGILGKLIANEEVSINGLNLLRLCLSQLGATPTDSSKVTLPEDEDDNDPADKYFWALLA